MTNGVFIKNGNRYKTYPSSTRKLCKLDTCFVPASGEFCRKHKEDIVKDTEQKCNRCFNIKIKSEFINKDDNEIEYTHCIQCREYLKQQASKHHDKRRRFILQLKIDMDGKCVECKSDDLEILEFDHVNPDDKIKEIRKIHNYDGMKKESEKCELRCVNCHLKKIKDNDFNKEIDSDNKSTIFSRKYRKKARDFIENIKLNCGGCEQCKFFDKDNLQILQFDHKDTNNKTECISRMMSSGVNIETIQLEINKCRILCGNCHRKRTLRQFNYPILEIINELK